MCTIFARCDAQYPMFNVAVCDVKHGKNEKEEKEMVEMMLFDIDRRNNVYIMRVLLLSCEVGRDC